MLEYYDEALESKIKAVFDNTKVAPPDDALDENFTDPGDGKLSVQFPLITIYRLENPPNMEMFYNHSMHRRGSTNLYINNHDEVQKTRSLPVVLTYQVDIWSKRRKDVDGIYRDLLFLIYDNPTIKLTLPNWTEEVNFNLQLDDVSNTTDIASFSDTGRTYRTTITLTLPEAQVFMQCDPKKVAKTVDIDYIAEE